jgi:hypothetical protein
MRAVSNHKATYGFAQPIRLDRPSGPTRPAFPVRSPATVALSSVLERHCTVLDDELRRIGVSSGSRW